MIWTQDINYHHKNIKSTPTLPQLWIHKRTARIVMKLIVSFSVVLEVNGGTEVNAKFLNHHIEPYTNFFDKLSPFFGQILTTKENKMLAPIVIDIHSK